jgi:type IV pilus assembly protein PilA
MIKYLFSRAILASDLLVSLATVSRAVIVEQPKNTKVRNRVSIIEKENGFTLVELMVVIVIVGILAAVAIPKFLDASNKAKASEFPTQLTAIYSGQLAYMAERGTAASTLQQLKDSSGVDVSSSSKWFIYHTAQGATISQFNAGAVVSTAFGTVTTSDSGSINETNAKSATPALQKYCPSWQ